MHIHRQFPPSGDLQICWHCNSHSSQPTWSKRNLGILVLKHLEGTWWEKATLLGTSTCVFTGKFPSPGNLQICNSQPTWSRKEPGNSSSRKNLMGENCLRKGRHGHSHAVPSIWWPPDLVGLQFPSSPTSMLKEEPGNSSSKTSGGNLMGKSCLNKKKTIKGRQRSKREEDFKILLCEHFAFFFGFFLNFYLFSLKKLSRGQVRSFRHCPSASHWIAWRSPRRWIREVVHHGILSSAGTPEHLRWHPRRGQR